jgi:hypothetical protein
MEFPNATAQEKFMLMLLERVDALTDEVNQLRACALPKSDDRISCPDIGCIASAAFIRARVANEQVSNTIADTLRDTNYVKEFVYDNSLTKHFTIDQYEEIDSDSEDNPNGVYAFQALVCFKHSVIASRIGVDLCNKVPKEQMCSIELQPLYDYRGGNFNADRGLFQYYYYHIVAAKYRTRPEKVGEREMTWIKSDGTTYVYDFYGNEFDKDDFSELIKSIDDRHITFHVCPWYYKQSR